MGRERIRTGRKGTTGKQCKTTLIEQRTRMIDGHCDTGKELQHARIVDLRKHGAAPCDESEVIWKLREQDESIPLPRTE